AVALLVGLGVEAFDVEVPVLALVVHLPSSGMKCPGGWRCEPTPHQGFVPSRRRLRRLAPGVDVDAVRELLGQRRVDHRDAAQRVTDVVRAGAEAAAAEALVDGAVDGGVGLLDRHALRRVAIAHVSCPSLPIFGASAPSSDVPLLPRAWSGATRL